MAADRVLPWCYPNRGLIQHSKADHREVKRGVSLKETFGGGEYDYTWLFWLDDTDKNEQEGRIDIWNSTGN